MILKIRKNYFIFGLVFLVAFFIFLGQINSVKAQTHGRDINTFAKPSEGTLFATEWNNLLGYNGTAVFASNLPLGSFVPTFLPAMMLGPLGIGMEPPVGGARLNVKADGANNILNLQNNAGAAVMTVLNSGNVGVGTTGPVGNLEIAGNNTVVRISDSITRNPSIELLRGTGAFGGDVYYDWKINNNAGNLLFTSGATSGNTSTILTLHNNGNVGIGTITPGHKLSVTGSATSYSIDAGNQRIGNVADPTATKDVVNLGYLNSSLSAFAPGGASSTWALNGNNIYNTNSGNVGIGTSEPLASLDVKGIGTTSATFAFNVQDSLGANKFRIQNNGQALVSNIAVTNLPEFGFLNDINTGLNWITTDTIGLMANGTTRFSCSGAACTAAVPTTLTRLTTTLDASIGTTLTAGRIGASSLILGGDPANSSLAALEAYGGVSAYAPPSGASIFYDTFSGGVTEQFPVHTPDTGTSWTMIIQNGVSTASSRNTGFAGPTATVADGGVLYTADANYTSADYEASTYVHAADSSDDLMYLAVRIQDANNMYAARISSSATGIYKKVGGTWTLLSPATLYLTAGNYVKLRVVGNVLSLYRGDALLLTVSDSDITAAGKAGLGFGNIGIATADDHDVTWQVDNFSVKLYEDSNLSALFMNGNVGIGTTAPTQKLSIGGSATYAIDAGNQRIGNVADPDTVKDVVTLGFLNSSLSAFAPGGASSTWTVSGNNIYNNNQTGNVGIGTTNPVSKLDIVADGFDAGPWLTISGGGGIFDNVGFRLYDTGSGAGNSNVIEFAHNYSGPIVTARILSDSVGANASGGSNLILQTTSNNISTWNSNQLFLSSSGNVGIGTANPGQKLDVVGNIKSSETVVASSGVFNGNTYSGELTSGVPNMILYNLGSVGRFFAYDGGSYYDLAIGDWNSGNPNIMLKVGGNVGINRGSPTYKLDVAGTLRTDNGANLATVSGNVGIGTTAPTQKLSIGGSATSYSIDAGNQRIGNVADPDTVKDVVTLGFLNSSLSAFAPGGASSTWALNGNNIYNTNSGNVGIGTSTPGLDKLRVVGGPVGIFGSLNLNNNNITGINKLTVNTIDPLYNIGGTNYSTFAAAIVGGVKEEYVGRLEVKTKRAFGDYEAVIDFNKQKEGTDLWVWHKTVDFSKENVEVFLSPYGDFARTYFLIEGEKLIVRADRPVTVSYRLVGRRLDWRKWPTKAIDQEEKASFIIN